MTGQARLSGSGQIGNTAVYRFRSNGRLDSAFGLNGISVNPFVGVNANNFLAVDLQEDAQGKIWVGHYGQNISGIRTFAVSRFLPNGAIDNSYGGIGYIMTGFAGDPDRIFLEPDGFPILTGTGNNVGVTNSKDMVAIKVKPTTVSVLLKETNQLIILPALAERGTPIRINPETNDPAEWQLINSSGQILTPERVEVQGDEKGIIIQTSQLSPGVYQIRQLSQKGIRQARLMVY
jgi:hypothetical protein